MTGVEPAIIIGIVGAVAAVAGTGVAVYSSIQAQEAAGEAAEAEQTTRNVEAENARLAADYEEKQFRRRAALLIGKNNALAAASGFDVSSGSPILQELDNIQQTELEALNIRRTGRLNESARQFEGRLAGIRGNIARSQRLPTALGGTLKAGSSVVGGWASYQKASSTPGYAGFE